MIKEITDSEIENARKVLSDHLVNPLNREGALESLLFCIASQATRWEKASNFIYSLRRNSQGDEHKYTSWEDLIDKEKVNAIALENNWRFAYNRRFDEAIDYFQSQRGEWWINIINSDSESREWFCEKIKWLSRKTFSFWHICLGGTNLLALDVYVTKGLSSYGLEINPHFFTPKSRSNEGQKVRKTPSKKEYLRIEYKAKSFFSQDERFLLPSRRLDMALVDSLLWWKGASRKDLNQGNLFGSGVDSWMLPYSRYSFSLPSPNSP